MINVFAFCALWLSFRMTFSYIASTITTIQFELYLVPNLYVSHLCVCMCGLKRDSMRKVRKIQIWFFYCRVIENIAEVD